MAFYLRLVVLLGGVLYATQAGAGETADEIQRLLNAGSAGEAYELGLARLPKDAGNPDFDFAFGLAALQVGQPQQAMFAFERILLLFPENDRVRLELARAHFTLGNLPEARTQFEIVLTHNPPPNVRERVKLFLAKIREQEAKAKPVYHGYTVFRVGYDTNVNASTADSNVVVPGLGLVTLAENAIELSGSFGELELAGEALRPISKKKALFGKISGTIRDNFNVDGGFDDEFDTASLRLRGGISFLGKRSVFRLPLEAEHLRLDGEEFRNLLFIGGEWERELRGRNRLTVFGQVGAIRYPEQEFRDVDLGLLGIAWVYRFARANRQIWLGIYYGDEGAVEDSDAAKANGRDYIGLYGGLQWSVTPRHLFYINASVQDIEHKDPQPIFNEIREDTFYRLAVGWNWRWRPKWSINIEAKYDNNDSNLELFTYDRTQVYTGVRFDFR